MRSKLVVAAVAVVAVGALVFFLSRPGAPSENVEPTPAVVKPPMVRAPPPEPGPGPAPVAVAPVAVAPPDASVEVATAPDAPATPDPLKTPKLFHHRPPPRSMGARFLALERRYNKARDAWTVARSHKNPAEQLRYDAMLNQIGDELSGGSKQAGAAELQDFVAQALDGVEP